MFPFNSVFYHLVLFAFNCLIFKELCRPLSHRLCLAAAFIYYHILKPLSTLFFKLFSILFFSGDRLADDFAILPPPYPFCQHLFSSSFDFFLFLSFHSLILVSGYPLVLFWLSSGSILVMTWLPFGSPFPFFILWVASLLFYWFSFHFIRNRFEPFYYIDKQYHILKSWIRDYSIVKFCGKLKKEKCCLFPFFMLF